MYNMTLAQVDDKNVKAAPPMIPPSVLPVELSEGPSIDAARLVSVYGYFKSKNIQHPLVSASKPAGGAVTPVVASSSTLPEPILPPSRPPSAGTLFRAALSNLGMLSLHQKERFHAVDQSMDFYRELKQLDGISERECQRIGVCFVPSGVHSLEGTFMNKNVSADYLRFLASLGWGYNVKENRQNLFTGSVDDPVYGAEILPYFANYSTEMIFWPVHLLNCSLENKVRLFNTANTVIIYCEDLDGYNPALFRQNRAHIVVNPLSTGGLYHASLYSKPGTFDAFPTAIGPISDKTVLSQALLAPMVRMTASNACRSFQPPGQFNSRQTKIAQMIERHARVMSPGEFYGQLFKDLTEDQLPPPIRMSTREMLGSSAALDAAKSPRGPDSIVKSPRPDAPKINPVSNKVESKSPLPNSINEKTNQNVVPVKVESKSPRPNSVNEKSNQNATPPVSQPAATLAPPSAEETISLPSIPVMEPIEDVLVSLAARPKGLFVFVFLFDFVLLKSVKKGPPLPSQTNVVKIAQPLQKSVSQPVTVPAPTTPSTASTPPRKIGGGGPPMPGGKAAVVGTPPLPSGSPMVARKVSSSPGPPMPGGGGGGGGVAGVGSPVVKRMEPEKTTPTAAVPPPGIPAGRAKRPPTLGRGGIVRGNDE